MTYKNRNDLDQISNDLTFINDKIEEYQGLINDNNKLSKINLEAQNDLMSSIIKSMNYFYNQIDPDGKEVYTDVFTKNGTYSGSEEMEFYLSKLFAFAKIFSHHFPIVVDCFRDGELTTNKESRIITVFNDLPNQIIFTVTLKNEESNKYNLIKSINAIDYDCNKTAHILNEKDAEIMNKTLVSLSL